MPGEPRKTLTHRLMDLEIKGIKLAAAGALSDVKLVWFYEKKIVD